MMLVGGTLPLCIAGTKIFIKELILEVKRQVILIQTML